MLKVLPRPDAQPSRFGFSASAKFGKAVARNRAKRLLGEAVRLFRERLKPSGYDAVLIARPPVREATLSEISQAVEELFQKADLLVVRHQTAENCQGD